MLFHQDFNRKYPTNLIYYPTNIYIIHYSYNTL